MLDQVPNQAQAPVPPSAPQNQQAPVPQKQTSHGGPKKGPIIILVVFLLLIGGSALAYFQEWYKMIPFFQEKEEEIKSNLTDLMYDRLAKLDGADFDLSYAMNVGPRDADAEAPAMEEEKKVDDWDIKSSLSSLKAAAGIYFDSEETYVGFCDNANIKSIEGKLEGTEFKCMDTEEQWAASAKLDNGFWCVDYTGDQNHTAIAINSSTCEGLPDSEPDPLSKSSELDFLVGDSLQSSWMFLENMIPEDLDIKMNFTGSGFSLANREKGKQDLPDVKVGLFGDATMESATFKLSMEAKAVSDDFYYKVSDFPFMDITGGHMDEWIKVSPESGWVSNIVPEYDEEQKKSVERFRDFIADTKKYNILAFSQSDQVLEMNGRQVNIFDVQINAENIPNWLEEARKIALESTDEDDEAFMKLEKELTAEEKKELVENINKALKNLTLSVGLDLENGDLMMIDAKARFIPPASSEKFKDKQFNINIKLKLSNHNNPPKITAPEVFVDQEVIEQEDLGMSDEQFNDYKQAQRVSSIREELAKYYLENREFPTELSMVTRLTKDRNTGSDFKYKKNKGNYELTYKMNTDITETELDSDDPLAEWGVQRLETDYSSPEYKLRHALGDDYLTYEENLWHSGNNIANRYSVVADQKEVSRNFLAEDTDSEDYSDVDVLQAAYQSKIIKKAKNLLNQYYLDNDEYPESILDLKNDDSYYFGLYDFDGYICEDLNTGGYCDYSTIDDGEDYEIKVSFPIASNMIGGDISLNSYKYEQFFVEGENVFTSKIVLDSDNDGLNDRDEEKFGTDKYNPDTDGDGYLDGEEVSNGYDPLSGANDLNDTDSLTLDNYWVRGDINAEITIIEYSDYDCPFCQRYHETMQQIMIDYDGEVKWIYRHFPLTALHPDAAKKAEAAECVGELGGNEAFWQFTDELYANKPTITELGAIVESLGYNKDSWQLCMDEEKFKTKVDEQYQEAQLAGANGTPYSLLVYQGNETPINGALPYESIKVQIDGLK